MNFVRPLISNRARIATAGLLAIGTIAGLVLPKIAANADTLTRVSINDVTKAEGTSAGTTAFTFTVSLNAASTNAVTVHYKTVDGSAKAGADYTAVEGDLTFAAVPLADLTKQVTVLVAADPFAEPDESFTVELSNLSSGQFTDSTGVGTITNDDTATPPPSLALTGPAPVIEGNSGTTSAAFTVTVTNPVNQAITVDYATASGSATQDVDYVGKSGTLTIAPNATTATIPVLVNGDTIDEANEAFSLSLSNPNNATLSTSTASATITDDDASPTVSIVDTSVAEGATNARNNATFQVNLSASSTRSISVDYTTAASASTPNATPNGDYIPTNGTLTIPAGSTSGVVNVTIIGDNITEPNEFFDVVISNPSNAVLGTAIGTATIQDDETQPIVSVSSPNVIEGNAGTTNAVVTFTMSSASGSTVTVDYATATGGTNGTATAGSDFTAASGTVTFAPGETTAQVNIAITGDLLDEDDETFRVVASNPRGGAAIAATPHGTVTITDDDTAPSLTINNVTQLEGSGSGVTPFVFTVTLSKASGRVVTVNAATGDPVQPTDPTAPGIPVASSASDYSAVATTVNFPAGTTTQTVTVNVNKDNIDEFNEVFNVILSGPTSATIADARGVGTITNDDAGPAVTITANTPSVTEGNSTTTPKTVTFTVSLAQASTKTVKVNYATVDGSATSATGAGSTADYAAASGTLTFNPGVTSQQVSVSINGDTFVEPDEAFSVDLSTPVNATIGSPSSATQLIQNDDAGTIPSVSVSNAPDATEGGNSVFTFTVTGTVQQTVTVNYTTVDGPVSGSGNPATQPADYPKTVGSVTFTVASAGPKTVSITSVDDTLDEDDEFFHLDITSVQNGTQSNTSGQAKIIDNDSPPTLTVADKAITEGTSATPTASTATVTLSAASSKQVTVDYVTGSGTATPSADYATTSGTLTFAPGETTKAINLSVVADSLDEADETFNITLSNPANSTIADGTGVVTITDDDTAPTVALGTAPSVSEGTGTATNTLDFPVMLSAASGRTVTVTVTPTAGTATAGTDFTATAITVTFAPGETVKNASVPVTADSVDEDNETVTATLSAPTNATLGTPATQTGTITDDDGAPTVSITGALSVVEGVNANFVATLSAASSKTITVKVASADGSATAGSDYTALASTTLSFAPGETTKTVPPIPTTDDTIDEADETFTVALSAPTNATLGSPSVGTATITDNDNPPTLSVADKSVAEGTSTAPTASTVTVTLSTASGNTVTVNYATGGGTATATTDYAPASGTLSFAPGEVSKTIPLSIVADSLNETDETFNVSLSTPSNATIADGTGLVTITDDDAQPTITFGAAPSVIEGSGSATNKLSFPVNLSSASGKTVTVTVTPSAGTATAGTDFTTTPITVTFAPGDTTKNADVPVTADSLDENNETVTATLSAPTNGTIGTPTSQTGTITDDDGTSSLSISDASATEGGKATFTVTLAPAASQTVTVKAASANGTATAPADYTALPATTLTFAAGDTTKTVEVQTATDTVNEPDETFTVTLSEPTGAALSTDKTGTGTIQGNAPAGAAPRITTGPGAGGGPSIQTFKPDFTKDGPGFFDGSETSGKRVARGDLDGDGVDEIISAAGPDSAGYVSVYSKAGALLFSVQPYGGTFRGGVFVAAGDIDGDGRDEIITGAGAGGGPHVRTYRYILATQSPASLEVSPGFYAYDGGFGGGVSVGAGDLDGDGKAEIITGMASQGSLVRSHKYTGVGTATQGVEFRPYAGFTGGAFVAAGDLTGDGKSEIVTSTGPGGGGDPHLRTFTPTGSAISAGVYAYNVGFRGGFSVAVGDLNGDGVAEIVTGAGPGGGPHVKIWSANLQEQGGFYAYSTAFTGGVWVSVGQA